MCPSDVPALFLLPFPTHASGSLIFMQRVSDWRAARHLVLVICPRCPDVCCWLAGYAGMCPSDMPALISFALPHTCTWIPPDSAVGERSACCLPCGAGYVPSLPRRVMLAGYAGMCPSDLPALFSFALPHTCIWIPPISAGREWSACCPPCGAG
jgi:hypothetical protein